MKKFRTKLAALLTGFAFVISGAAIAATFNLFQPATGLLKGNANTYVTTAATASDVVGLWSGTCNAFSFLRGDGTCVAEAGTGTVTSVGLTMPAGLSVAGSPVTTSGTLAVTTTLSGLVNGTGTGFANATAANVTAEFTGTCSATTFLRGDGQCATPAGGAPGGPQNGIQYNNAGVFNSTAAFTFDGTSLVTLGSNTSGTLSGRNQTVANGANLTVVAGGAVAGSGNGGVLFLSGGESQAGQGGDVQILGGQPAAGTFGGTITILGGDGTTGGGGLELGSGNGGTTGGPVSLQAGTSTNGPGAVTTIAAGDAGGTNMAGGDLRLSAGVGTGTGASGIVRVRTAGVNRLVIDGAGAWNVSNAGTGTAGQVLTSNGAAPPTWQAAGGGGAQLGVANTWTALQTMSFAPVATYGNFALRGTAAGAANVAYMSFSDSAGTRTGYIGDDSGSNSDITIQSNAAGSGVALNSGTNTVRVGTTGTNFTNSNLTAGFSGEFRIPIMGTQYMFAGINGIGGCVVDTNMSQAGFSFPCTRNSAGNYIVVYNGANAAACTANAAGTTPLIVMLSYVNSGSVGISIYNTAGTATDARFMLTCFRTSL